MIRRILILLSVALPFLFLASCSSDPDEIPVESGKGSISIEASTDTGIDLIERSTTRANTDVSTYTLVLEQEGAEPIIIASMPSDGIVNDIPAGSYKITLASNYDGFTPAFEEPTYEGIVENVSVVSNKTTSVSITCEQSNASVYFVYDKSLETIGGYTNIIPTITQDEYSLVYEGANKEARGYFLAKRASLSLKDVDTPIKINGADSQPLSLGARQLWEITLTMATTDGKLHISATVKVIDAPTNKVEFEVSLDVGTEASPLSVDMLPGVAGSTEMWTEGYVVQPVVTRSDNPKGFIYIADSAEEKDVSNCAKIILEDGSDIQARLNIVDHPGLVGEKIQVKGDILDGGTLKGIIENVTAEKGGREPIEKPDIPTGDVEVDKMYGYAALAGTTGGEGATPNNIHHFDDGNKLRAWLKLREKAKDKTPAIVWMSGKFTKENGRDGNPQKPIFDVKDTDNISFYGTDDFVMDQIGFFLVRSNNIIIRNIYFRMPKADNGADAISTQKSSKIWVDHCTFESLNKTKDYEDGSCDVTHGTHSVTISWNHFVETQKTSLVGHSNSETGDKQITVTYHHNFFEKSRSRHPRVRFGKAHVYNNYYDAVDTYGVGSAYEAKVLVENNYFDAVRLPIDICTFPAKKSGSSWISNLTGSVAGYVFEHGNTYDNPPSNISDVMYPFTNLEYTSYNGPKLGTPLTYSDFEPPYEYDINAAEEVRAIVEQYSGVRKLDNFRTAPIEVNNGNMPDEPGEPGEPEPDPDPDEGTEIGGGWTMLSYRNSNASSFVNENGSLTMTAKGKFEGKTQDFGFVYQQVTGDFVATMKLNSYSTDKGNTNQAMAGLMMTPDIAAFDNDFMHAMSGKSVESFYYSHRLEGKNASRGGLNAPANGGDEVYLKLERTGDTYNASYSLDGGVTYGNPRSGEFVTPLPQTIYVGVAVSSGDNSTKVMATANVSDFKINGVEFPFSEED